MRVSRSLLARGLASAGILAVLFLVLPWEEFQEAFRAIALRHWLAGVGIFLAMHGLGAVKWRLLINAGRGNLAAGQAAGFYASGLFANLCLPTIVGGDALRAALAVKETGRKVAVLIGSVADRLIDVLALALLVTAGTVRVYGHLPDAAGVGLALAALLGGAGAGGVALALRRRGLGALSSRWSRIVGRSLVAARRLRREPGMAARALLIALTIQTGFILLNAWLGSLIGIRVSLAVWFVAWPLAKFAGLLPVSLGGLGVRDATLAGILVPFGVPMAKGVIAGLLWQSILIGGGLLAGAAWWLFRDGQASTATMIRRLARKAASESGR